MKVLRSFTKLVAFSRLNATITVFQKIRFFFGKKTIFSLQKNQIMNVWDFLPFRSHPKKKNILYLAKIKKDDFFLEILFFRNYPKVWTFWEVLLLQSHSMTNLQHLPIFKIFFFFKKSINYEGKIRTFWEIVIFPPPSTTNLLNLAISKKLMFSAKPN